MSRRPKFTRFRNRKSSNERSREGDSPDRSYGHWRQSSSERNHDNFNSPSTSYWEETPGMHRGRRGGRFGKGDKSRGGFRHPAGLKGVEIGMWYRDKYKEQGPKDPKPKHRLEIRLDSRTEEEIKELLDQVRTADPNCGRGFQIKKEPSSAKALNVESSTLAQVKLEENEEYFSAFCDSEMKGSPLDNCPTSTSYHRSSGDVSVDEWKTVEKRPHVKTESGQASQQAQCHSSKNHSSHDHYQNIKDSVFKRDFLLSITESIEEKLDRMIQSQLALEQNPELDQKLRESLLAKRNSQQYLDMLAFREKLPAHKMKDEILELIRGNQVVVVSGETGCGKTTQVAQFILDDQILQNKGSTCHLICTQPRRISATSVAERVADERNEILGMESVGYQIRLERKLPSKVGSVVFCTTGVLLQRMQFDPALSAVSHVILDEIHERDIVCDFVISLLRDVIAKRSDLKVILMSATLNALHFSKYFNDCPCINIPGFTFPVEELYLEDVLELTHFQFPTSKASHIQEPKWKKYSRKGKEARSKDERYSELIDPFVRNLDWKKYSAGTRQELLNPKSEELNCDLIAELITHICRNKPDGAILVFVPGWTDISKLNKILTGDKFFLSSRFRIIPLHSMMPTTVQRSVFERPPPSVRKIILATNIAETSITIDDVVYVIDSGKIKMKQYDVESNIQTLLPEWVSLANARQRRGRAGRVQPGVCYHLYTRAREMTFSNYPLPEMLRSRLDEVILTAKIQQVGPVKKFLSKVMNPPHPRAIDVALQLLCTMNALDKDENLTPLGYHLAKLPVDPQTGKMILLGALFSCVDPIFSVAASLSFKDAFVTPLGKEKEVDERKVELADGSKSDHLLIADVIRKWEQAERRGHGSAFCWDNFLSYNTLKLLKDMKEQFGRYLHEMKFLSSEMSKAPESNVNSHNRSLVKAIICAGLYPNVAFVHKARRFKFGVSQKISTMEERKVAIHPRSINAQCVDFESPFIVYHLKLKSAQIYLHDSTVVYPMPLLFFGEDLQCFLENGVEMVSVNDSIKFRCNEATANLIKELKQHMSTVLEDKVCHPETIKWTEEKSRECSILRAILELIAFEDKRMMEGYDNSDCDSDD